MLKFTLRYALTVFATVGFGINSLSVTDDRGRET